MLDTDRFWSHPLLLGLLLISPLNVGTANSQVFDERYSDWPEDTSINGQVIIVDDFQNFEKFRMTLTEAVKGKNAVCLRAAEQTSGSVLMTELQTAIGPTGNLTTVSSAALPGKLIESLAEWSDCLVIESIAGTSEELSTLKPAIDKLIAGGGTLMIDVSVAEKFADSLHLLPDCVLQFEAIQDEATTTQMLQVLAENPRTIGVLMSANSALVLAGRKVMCFGEGELTFLLPANDVQPKRTQTISGRRSRHQSPEEYLIDLTQWRRDAIDRDLEPFPPRKPNPPYVENGTLLIVGGGGSPAGLMDRFIELAGGIEDAQLVYVPCSEDGQVSPQQGMVENWRRLGISHATFVHTKDRQQANSDQDFLRPLRNATGIFFGGGRQWNFSDSYYGTEAHRLMKEVLNRGGVIAGSSAGASIQARYLARATPIGNFDIMAFGYERGGLGFISGVAIDQHFSQRGRQKDMTQLINVYPQLLGIGIDEQTAIEVQKSIATVSGPGRVFFYDTTREKSDDEPDYIALPAGSSYDLARRKVIVDKRE